MASQTSAIKRLSELKSLPVGWDYGRGVPISMKAWMSGIILIQILSKIGSTEFDVVPGDCDGVVIVSYHGEKSAETHCLSNGQYDLLHEDATGAEIFAEDLSMADLISVLESFGWQSPRFYASCTRNAMFQASDDSLVLPLGTRQEVAYRLLAPIASPKKGRRNANTSAGTITKQSVGNRQSSGVYLSMPFQEAIA